MTMPTDAHAVMRSPGYLRLLVLAAVIGAPIAATAYGFLWLVDEPALVAALKEGRLGAAALDVFENEPQVPEALLAMDNVVLTPHIASSTDETMTAMGECVLDNLRSWFAGKGALTPAQ